MIFYNAIGRPGIQMFRVPTFELAKAIKAQSSGDRDQECDWRLDITFGGLVPAQVDVLHDILRFSSRPEHAVSNAKQSSTMCREGLTVVTLMHFGA